MIYLSQMMGKPVRDAAGEELGVISDLAISTGEVFPRITSLAFKGPGNVPFMISWRKYVGSFDDCEVRLKVVDTDIRFSYLQPDEVLIRRDLLNKQIVDTRGMRVVRVNDLKLSDTSSSQLRLLGAEVGARGILRSLSPHLERIVTRCARALGKPIPERIIAWNYMDLLDRDLSSVKLSVTHKTLDELHPADIADILERLDPRLRGQVFAQLESEQAAEAMAEFDDDAMAAEIMGDMEESEASRMLSEMDPDDAAELVSELDYEKAEKLLRLMGVKERKAIRQLLGYRENTAGRIMTSEALIMDEGATVGDAVERLRNLDDDFETVHYVYLKDDEKRLSGIVTLQRLVKAEPDERLSDISIEDELITANPDDDQEDVAENIAKYNLLAMPVVDDNGVLLGIVTVDDALDVLEEEHAEDLQIAGGSTDGDQSGNGHDLMWLLRRNAWFFIWMLGAVVMAIVALGRVSLESVLLASAGLPIALIVADDSITYVTNFFLENDPDDEDSPSLAGFAVRSLGIGLVFALLVLLMLMVFNTIVRTQYGMGSISSSLTYGFIAAAASTLVSFATAPIYLHILHKRDEQNKETSGFSLSLVAMFVALAVFAIVCYVVARIVMV